MNDLYLIRVKKKKNLFSFVYFANGLSSNPGLDLTLKKVIIKPNNMFMNEFVYL